MTIAEFLETYYFPSRVSLTREYQDLLRAAARMYGEHLGRTAALADLEETLIAGWLTTYRARWSASATNGKRRQLLTIWTSAYDHGLVDRPPRPRLIRKLPECQQVPEAWTAEECQRLFLIAGQWPGTIADLPASRWWLSLLLAIYWSGCRIGSMMRARLADYSPGRGLLVRHSKNGRPQWFSLPASCRAEIEATLAVDRELLWPWPLHPNGLWTEMRRIVESAAIPAPRTRLNLFHRLRRTNLSLCAAVDPALAQRQAGHADYRTTLASYIDPRIAVGRSAADVLPEPEQDYQTLRIYVG